MSAEYETDHDGWVTCRFCAAPIEKSGFASWLSADGVGWWHRDGSDACLTPQPRRVLESDR